MTAIHADLGERHSVTGEPLCDLPPGCPDAYLMPLPGGMEPSFRDLQRATILGEQLLTEHDEKHRRYGHPFCPACRPERARGSLLRMLTLKPGFDPLGIDCGGEGAETRRSAFYTYDDLDCLPEPEWLIQGIIPQGGIGYITGRDGSYKTFLAIDVAVTTVLCGASPQWHGDRWVEVGGWGRALILEGEGVSSMRKRIDAAVEGKGATLTEEQKRSIVVRNGTVNLHGGNGEFHELLEYVREFQPDVIVVDTLNRSAGAADQNSASDMSVITQRLHLLAAAAEERADHGERCTVIVVAHTDKGDNDARGSSAIEDDADFVLHCKKTGDRLKVKVAKMKDGESDFDIHLQAKPVGQSLALVEASEAPAVLWSASAPRSRVIGALRTLQPQGWASQADIYRVTETDGFDDGRAVNRGTVSREINRLITEGGVEKHASAKQYRLVEGWVEPLPESAVPSLEEWVDE